MDVEKVLKNGIWKNYEDNCKICFLLKKKELYCEVCEIRKDIWICIICGYIGCGRYSQTHAIFHYLESNHKFSISLDKNNIWNYKKDIFSHRLSGNVCDKEEEIENEEDFLEDQYLNYERLIDEQLFLQKQFYQNKEFVISKKDQDKIEKLEKDLTYLIGKFEKKRLRIRKNEKQLSKIEKEIQIEDKLKKSELEKQFKVI